MLNNTVNNSGIQLSSFRIFFQHIRGKHNVMTDVLSRLKRKGLYIAQDPEPDGVKFGHTVMEYLPKVHVNHINVCNSPTLPKSVENCQIGDIASKQTSDKFCPEVKDNLKLPKFSDYKVEDDILYQRQRLRIPYLIP